MTVTEILTEESWVESNNRFYSDLVDDPRAWELMAEAVEYRARRDFRAMIISSEWCVRGFFSWPKGLQTTFSFLVSEGLTLGEIETYLKLLFKLQKNFDESNISIDVMGTSFRQFCSNIDKALKPMNDKNSDYVESVLESIENQVFYRNAFCILRILYGESETILVIKEWMKTGLIIQLPILASLIEKWDEFNELPMAWAINLANDV